MSEARLLFLVALYPHPRALARRTRDASVFASIRRLEARGYVTRRRGVYRITGRGRAELAMAKAVARLLPRGV